MNKSRLILVSSVVAAGLYGVDASAQSPAAAAAAAPAAPAAAPAEAVPAPAEVAPAPAPEPAPVAAAPVAAAPAADAGESDHDAVVGHIGVGYLGFVNVPFGYLNNPDTNAYPGNQIAAAPVVGIRYWFSPSLGLDVGLGFTTTFGNNSHQLADGTTQTTNASAPTAFVLHGGLPLAFASAKHYAFELIPELNFGYAQRSVTNTGVETIDDTGMHFDVGARVGAEIYFGFIGIPQLALQGSVGLRIDVNQTQTKHTPATTGGVVVTDSSSRSVISTTVYDKPWDIFLGNISAIYYL